MFKKGFVGFFFSVVFLFLILGLTCTCINTCFLSCCSTVQCGSWSGMVLHLVCLPRQRCRLVSQIWLPDLFLLKTTGGSISEDAIMKCSLLAKIKIVYRTKSMFVHNSVITSVLWSLDPQLLIWKALWHLLKTKVGRDWCQSLGLLDFWANW